MFLFLTSATACMDVTAKANGSSEVDKMQISIDYGDCINYNDTNGMIYSGRCP